MGRLRLNLQGDLRRSSQQGILEKHQKSIELPEPKERKSVSKQREHLVALKANYELKRKFTRFRNKKVIGDPGESSSVGARRVEGK